MCCHEKGAGSWLGYRKYLAIFRNAIVLNACIHIIKLLLRTIGNNHLVVGGFFKWDVDGG